MMACVDDVCFTRLGLLSKVASVFDPQGIASPLTIKTKIMIRLLDTKGVDHNEAISPKDRKWWKQWFQTLKELDNVKLGRCLFPKKDDIARTELHTFGDASKEAYAAIVLYLRQVYRDGAISVHFVKAATKLAPNRSISIPKMELNAALLAARLVRTVQQSLTRKVHQRFIWTDSSTVRNWIPAPDSSYQVFVANRIGEIQTLTSQEEWRFVSGKQNLAVAATRSAFGEEGIPAVWLQGPAFLDNPKTDGRRTYLG